MAVEGQIFGKCGIFCRTCKLYILRKCEGCLHLYARKDTKCSYYQCVEKKQIDSCGACREFPCLEHYGSMAVFTKKKLLDWKKREIGKENR